MAMPAGCTYLEFCVELLDEQPWLRPWLEPRPDEIIIRVASGERWSEKGDDWPSKPTAQGMIRLGCGGVAGGLVRYISFDFDVGHGPDPYLLKDDALSAMFIIRQAIGFGEIRYSTSGSGIHGRFNVEKYGLPACLAKVLARSIVDHLNIKHDHSATGRQLLYFWTANPHEESFKIVKEHGDTVRSPFLDGIVAGLQEEVSQVKQMFSVHGKEERRKTPSVLHPSPPLPSANPIVPSKMQPLISSYRWLADAWNSIDPHNKTSARHVFDYRLAYYLRRLGCQREFIQQAVLQRPGSKAMDAKDGGMQYLDRTVDRAISSADGFKKKMPSPKEIMLSMRPENIVATESWLDRTLFRERVALGRSVGQAYYFHLNTVRSLIGWIPVQGDWSPVYFLAQSQAAAGQDKLMNHLTWQRAMRLLTRIGMLKRVKRGWRGHATSWRCYFPFQNELQGLLERGLDAKKEMKRQKAARSRRTKGLHVVEGEIGICTRSGDHIGTATPTLPCIPKIGRDNWGDDEEI